MQNCSKLFTSNVSNLQTFKEKWSSCFFTELNRKIFLQGPDRKDLETKSQVQTEKKETSRYRQGQCGSTKPKNTREYHYQIGVFSGFSIMRSKLLWGVLDVHSSVWCDLITLIRGEWTETTLKLWIPGFPLYLLQYLFILFVKTMSYI